MVNINSYKYEIIILIILICSHLILVGMSFSFYEFERISIYELLKNFFYPFSFILAFIYFKKNQYQKKLDRTINPFNLYDLTLSPYIVRFKTIYPDIDEVEREEYAKSELCNTISKTCRYFLEGFYEENIFKKQYGPIFFSIIKEYLSFIHSVRCTTYKAASITLRNKFINKTEDLPYQAIYDFIINEYNFYFQDNRVKFYNV